MTENEIIAGQTVTFRPEFSEHLIGIEWEIVPMPTDGAMIGKAAATNGEAAYLFCQLRRRVGKAQRWGYRFARISNLIPA